MNAAGALAITAALVARFTVPARPAFDERDRALAALGKRVFYDPGFSKDGTVSCATCHRPEHAFTDGKVVARGLGKTARNTPTLINAAAMTWFFWDGRADSLAAQALDPLLQPAEQGLSRAGIVARLKDRYAGEYETLFGALPDEGHDAVEGAGSLADVVARYAVDTLPMGEKKALIARATGAQVPAHRLFLRDSMLHPSPVRAAGDRATDRVLAHLGSAIAAYERGLIADESPFDAFAARVAQGTAVAAALGPGFGREELAGFGVFVGKGRCALCHDGPYFTDQQFHNVGLSSAGAPYDLGRAAGLPLVRASAFNCRGGLLPVTQAQSCLSLPFLDDQATETVGAFKTPTLRNVAQTAPYGHDGRFPSLEAVVRRYATLNDGPGLGHREETLRPVSLDATDVRQLVAFLRSLTSPVRELLP